MSDPSIRAGKSVEWREGMTEEQYLEAVRAAETRVQNDCLSKDDKPEERLAW